MAFQLDGFLKIVQGVFVYNSTDAVATMLADGYFNRVRYELAAGDLFFLLCDATGTIDMAYVTSATHAQTITLQASEGVTESSGTPEWLPEGAIAYTDPANNRAYINGAEVALADILIVSPEYPEYYNAIGDLADLLNTDCVVVFGLTLTDIVASSSIYVHTREEGTEYLLRDNAGQFSWYSEPGDVEINEGSTANGFHKIAVRQADSMGISVDGSAEDADARTVSATGAPFSLEIKRTDGVQLDWFAVYPANAALPALSALPTPAWLPEGAVAFADFRAGNYYADGAEAALASIVVEDEALGAFSISAITAQGIDLLENSPCFTPLVGALVTTGFTFVAEIGGASGVTAYARWFESPDWNQDLSIGMADDGSKWAGTFRPTSATWSENGDPIQVSDGQEGSLCNAFGVHCLVPGGTVYLRSLAIYPIQADAALPALSALS